MEQFLFAGYVIGVFVGMYFLEGMLIGKHDKHTKQRKSLKKI